jgi:hypothetical protein
MSVVSEMPQAAACTGVIRHPPSPSEYPGRSVRVPALTATARVRPGRDRAHRRRAAAGPPRPAARNAPVRRSRPLRNTACCRRVQEPARRSACRVRQESPRGASRPLSSRRSRKVASRTSGRVRGLRSDLGGGPLRPRLSAFGENVVAGAEGLGRQSPCREGALSANSSAVRPQRSTIRARRRSRGWRARARRSSVPAPSGALA